MQVSRFQTLAQNKDLVEQIKQDARDTDDLPDGQGNVFDCEGNLIATPESSMIEYDNGYFYAELIE